MFVADGANRRVVQLPALTRLTVTTQSMPATTVGATYPPTALAAALGRQPYKWSLVSGNLPAGLAMTPDGIIGGSATAIGTSTFTVQVTDAARRPATATAALSIDVGATVVAGSNPSASVSSPSSASGPSQSSAQGQSAKRVVESVVLPPTTLAPNPKFNPVAVPVPANVIVAAARQMTHIAPVNRAHDIVAAAQAAGQTARGAKR